MKFIYLGLLSIAIVYVICSCTVPPKVTGHTAGAGVGCDGYKVGYYVIQDNLGSNRFGIAMCGLPINTKVCSPDGLLFKPCED